MLVPSFCRAGEVSYELDSDLSYVWGANTDLGSLANKEVTWKTVPDGALSYQKPALSNHLSPSVSEEEGWFRAVVCPQITDTLLLRAGVDWRRYSFGVPSDTPLPDTLQSTSLVLGADMQLGNSWLARIEATPGCYGNFHRVDDKDFDSPFTIGGSYIASPDLQWILGIEVDINNRFPVLPGVGVRWKFAEKWVFDGLLPTPRLEYSYSKSWTFFIGADLQMSTYHVDQSYGTSIGKPALNDALVDYTEVRTGVGASWKITRSITAELETGYMPYRDFEFYRANVDVRTISGAPYAQIALSGRF